MRGMMKLTVRNGQRTFTVVATLIAICTLAMAPEAVGRAQEVDPAAREFSIGSGAFSLSAPQTWKRVRPKSMIVETEFAVPAVEDGQQAGRVTVMGAGGSVTANVERWYGQFSQPDGSPTKVRAATKQIKLAGCSVTMVDVTGTYKDMPGGPFAGGQTIERPDYRMLAAIVETPSEGNYFIKFYGPAAIVAREADGFRTMVEGMVAAK